MAGTEPRAEWSRAGARPWTLRPPFCARQVVVVALAVVCVLWAAERQGLGEAAQTTARMIFRMPEANATEFTSSRRLLEDFWPLRWSEEIRVADRPDLQQGNLPWGTRREQRERMIMRVNPETLLVEQKLEWEEVWVIPWGYARLVAARMLETLEIGLLATLLGVLWSVPLAILGARGYAPAHWVRQAARAVVALFRAVPELISALFLVLVYGFGPVAGVLALGLHCTGFLGKFFAEEIEHADKAPQDALAAHGAGRLKVLRYAVWPQVMPQYVGYVCYVLDRNVRMATVIGLVGAGGIGQELKGRYDLFQFGHVSTILLAIFVVVLALDQLSAWVRARAG